MYITMVLTHDVLSRHVVDTEPGHVNIAFQLAAVAELIKYEITKMDESQPVNVSFIFILLVH